MDNITNKEREEDVFLWKKYCDGDISLYISEYTAI